MFMILVASDTNKEEKALSTDIMSLVYTSLIT